MAITSRPGRVWRVAILGARLEDALHRCIQLASPHGTIVLRKPVDPGTREFILDLNQSGSHRLRWILKAVASGTELSVEPRSPGAWLPGRGLAEVSDQDLERKLRLLPTALNLKIVALGGGTGLYTTLRGLRDRSWNLTAVVASTPRRGVPPDPKDELGLLPRDDASMCLVALAPASDDTMVLRALLEHRMHEGQWRGTHVGPVLLEALAEIRGSHQAALDAAGGLLGMRGRIVPAAGGDSGVGVGTAVEALMDANLVVIAPGRVDADLAPVLGLPGITQALQKTSAIKVAVTKIMTAEGDPTDEPTTSYQLRAISAAARVPFDIVLANSATFTRAQLDAYAAVGAHPVIPDAQATSHYARLVLTERLVAPGQLARHDPKELGEALIALGTDSFLAGSRAAQALAV
jgi:2-phospho-L-lactate transferase/gluconeogenesis factor (CofD/UPF0052 family)